MSYNEQHAAYIARCDLAIHNAVQRVFNPLSRVSEAGDYALLNGGKRVRGVLVLAVSELLGGDFRLADAFAAAIEMIHAFSLIHDDLPCMDDDDMRRGKPSTHIAFGEATALLAGDMLALEAFRVIADQPHDARLLAEAVVALAKASGAYGMIYGQELDLKYENTPAAETDLLQIVRGKTVALIAAAVRLGAISAGVAQDGAPLLAVYADNIGMVFQLVDDVLNATSSAEVMGKPVGNDAERGKTTFVSIYGVDEARLMAHRLTAEATAALRQTYGAKADFLCEYAEALVGRVK